MGLLPAYLNTFHDQSDVSMNKTLISRADYQQIFRTIYSVLMHEKADLPRACVAFNVIGAVLLNEFYGIQSRPFAGIASYCVCSDPRSVILFADQSGSQLTPADKAFHCWIETKDWVIDFSTPLFPLITKEKNFPDPGRKMMQRKIASSKHSPQDLAIQGDFFLAPDQDFTLYTLKKFAEVPFHRDLIEICRRWFVRPPDRMMPVIGLANQHGKVAEVPFLRYEVIGAW